MGRLLVVPNATRWNSSYDAWVVLNKMKDHDLNNLLNFIGESALKPDELSYIQEYVEVKIKIF